jgi:hypothetical protein
MMESMRLWVNLELADDQDNESGKVNRVSQSSPNDTEHLFYSQAGKFEST